MKLSDLVKQRTELLARSNHSKILAEAEAMNSKLLDLNDQSINDLAEYVSRNIANTLAIAKNRIDSLVSDVNENIIALEANLLSKTANDFAVDLETDQKYRQLTIPDNVKDILVGRIRLYADWHYPGLEIGPRDGQFTAQLVGLDPLYVVDARIENIQSALSQFPIEYQNRVCKYLVDYSVPEKTLMQLPHTQFGFAFSWNLFNYVPFNDVKKYLTGVFALLRPGGTFLFGFNDASMVLGACQVEWSNMAYMTKEMLVTAAQRAGFEVAKSYGFDVKSQNLSWLEVKRPGTLTTIKAHQTLGIIKDFEQKKS